MSLLTHLGPHFFCDTSFFYACLDNRDINSARARVLVREAAATACFFYCTWDIISETATLLRYRCIHGRAVRFLDEVKPTLRIISYDDSVRSQAEQAFRRLGKDKRLSFCDALSFVVVTSLLDGMPCLSFDRDFKRLGLTVLS